MLQHTIWADSSLAMQTALHGMRRTAFTGCPVSATRLRGHVELHLLQQRLGGAVAVVPRPEPRVIQRPLLQALMLLRGAEASSLHTRHASRAAAHM